MRKGLPLVSGAGHSCLLSEADLRERAAQWRALAARARRRTTGQGIITSTYPRDDELIGTLRALIAAEAECCSFLTFDVREHGDEIEVELRYPNGFEAAIGEIFTG